MNNDENTNNSSLISAVYLPSTHIVTRGRVLTLLINARGIPLDYPRGNALE